MNNKLKYFLLTLTVLLLGLASRHFSSPNSFMYDHVGDGLWAAMIYFGFRFLKPEFPQQKTGIIALSFCFLIEISQLYQAPWINAVRHTTLGGLVLGFGFLWSDLVGYCVGVFVAWLFDNYVLTKSSKATTI
jgi:hypothetical protein